MKTGKVVGSIWATKKDSRINGQKLLLIKTDVEILVATDIIGAGVDDIVLLVSGTSARIAAGNDNIPVDLAVVAIVDSIEETGSTNT